MERTSYKGTASGGGLYTIFIDDVPQTTRKRDKTECFEAATKAFAEGATTVRAEATIRIDYEVVDDVPQDDPPTFTVSNVVVYNAKVGQSATVDITIGPEDADVEFELRTGTAVIAHGIGRYLHTENLQDVETLPVSLYGRLSSLDDYEHLRDMDLQISQ